ncbi:MAG: GTP 3',8-cyclase MoaA [Actinobacteria bacterium]|nr:GTP 3',8-cyclase MoaA [Actinomycetota bacterium]
MSELYDGFNRRIDYLRLSITDRCNLRCTYCMPEEGIEERPHGDILSYEELETFTTGAVGAGISKVRVTGGEPLVRKDAVDLIAMLAALPNLNDVSLTTNGVLLEEHAADLAKAGLARVNISIDSLDPAVYRKLTRWGRVDRALSGLRKALEVGLEPVKVNAVLLRGVNDDPSDFIKLTYDYPVHVRFIEHMPIGKSKAWSPEDFVSIGELKESLARYGKLEESAGPVGAGPATYLKFKEALGTVGFISPISRHFCDECNRLRLTPDGRLRVCLFSDEEMDVRPAIWQGEAAVKAVIAKALKTKPKEHATELQSFKRLMFQIGG